MTGVLMRKRRDTRGLFLSPWAQGEKAQRRHSRKALPGSWGEKSHQQQSCSHLDLDSRLQTMRKYMSVVQATQPVLFCDGSLGGLIQMQAFLDDSVQKNKNKIMKWKVKVGLIVSNNRIIYLRKSKGINWQFIRMHKSLPKWPALKKTIFRNNFLRHK